MVKQGASSGAQAEEKGPWNVERGAGHLGRIQECGQSHKGCQKQQEGILQLHQQQKKG